jgi:hypothetical protein
VAASWADAIGAVVNENTLSIATIRSQTPAREWSFDPKMVVTRILIPRSAIAWLSGTLVPMPNPFVQIVLGFCNTSTSHFVEFRSSNCCKLTFRRNRPRSPARNSSRPDSWSRGSRLTALILPHLPGPLPPIWYLCRSVESNQQCAGS